MNAPSVSGRTPSRLVRGLAALDGGGWDHDMPSSHASSRNSSRFRKSVQQGSYLGPIEEVYRACPTHYLKLIAETLLCPHWSHNKALTKWLVMTDRKILARAQVHLTGRGRPPVSAGSIVHSPLSGRLRSDASE